MAQVFDFLGVAEREPSEAAIEQADIEVLAFDVAGADSGAIWMAGANPNPRADTLAWRISAFTVFPVNRIGIEFYQLGKIKLAAKDEANTGCVRAKAIRRQLKGSGNAGFDVVNHLVGRVRIALADDMAQNQFRLCVHAHEQILVAALVIVRQIHALLAADKGEQLVHLQGFDCQAAHSFIQQPGALLASGSQDVQNRFLMQPGKPLNGTDAHTFNQQVNHLMRLFLLDPHSVQRLLHAERFGATWTAVALNEAVAIAEKPEFLRLTIAAMTCHLTFPGQVLQWFCIVRYRLKASAFGCALSAFARWQGFVFVSVHQQIDWSLIFVIFAFSSSICLYFSEICAVPDFCHLGSVLSDGNGSIGCPYGSRRDGKRPSISCKACTQSKSA